MAGLSPMPSFIVCGAQRAGTTALHRYLRLHPQVYMPRKKEIHFFDKHYGRGPEWYAGFFRAARAGRYRAVGEATPSYMYIAEAAERIRSLLPGAKLIFILRHPVERAYSHYWLEVRLGVEHLSFEEALEAEPRRLASGRLFDKIHYSYFDRGRYAEQLERFLGLFPRSQLFVATYRELAEDPRGLLARISRFIGVDPGFWEEAPLERRYNVGRSPRSWRLHGLVVRAAGKLGFESPLARMLRLASMLLNMRRGYPPMRPGTRARLLERYEEWNRRLERLLGLRLPWWYE